MSTAVASRVTKSPGPETHTQAPKGMLYKAHEFPPATTTFANSRGKANPSSAQSWKSIIHRKQLGEQPFREAKRLLKHS